MREAIQTLQEFIQNYVEEYHEQFFGLLAEGGSGEVKPLLVYFNNKVAESSTSNVWCSRENFH